jgi:hypothetical protein
MGIVVYLLHRYSGGGHDSKMVWKRLKVYEYEVTGRAITIISPKLTVWH